MQTPEPTRNGTRSPAASSDSAEKLTVEREVAIGHVVDAEAGRHRRATGGTVDLADLNAVRNNFGASLPAPAATPALTRAQPKPQAADAVLGELLEEWKSFLPVKLAAKRSLFGKG